MLSLPTNAILSPFKTVKLILLSILFPSIVLHNLFTDSISFPAGFSILKSIYGYFLDDGTISSNSIFSSIFFLDVACLDFEAFAENLAIKDCNSFIFSSFFLLASFICFSAS